RTTMRLRRYVASVHFPSVAIDVSVGDGDIQLTVEIGIEEHCAESQPPHAERPEARWVAPFLKDQPAAIAKEIVAMMIKIGDEQTRATGTVDVARLDAHAGHRLRIRSQGAAGEQRPLHEAALALVVKQVSRLLVVGHVDVDQSVAVQVYHEHAESRRRRRGGDARGPADVRKGAVAIIAIKL